MKQKIKTMLVFALMIITAASFSVYENPKLADASVKAPGKVGTITAKPISEHSVKITWSKAKGASGYQLQRNGKTIRKQTARAFTDTKLKSGTKYSYRVRAYKTYKQKQWYNKKTKKWTTKKPKKKYRGKTRKVTAYKYGKFSKTYKATTYPSGLDWIASHDPGPVETMSVGPQKVTGLTYTAGYLDLTLKWSVAKHADGYIITKDGTKIGETTGTSYKITGLAPLTSYTFGVQSYMEDIEERQTAEKTSISAKTLRTPAPKNIRVVSTTTDSITIGWDAVTGATKYNVKSPVDSKWKKVEADTLTYTETGLNPNTTYTFYVRAYVPIEYSLTEDGALNATTKKEGLPAPTGATATNITSRTAQLKWNTVSGANGYTVYNSSMNEIGTTTSCSFLVKGLKAENPYDYYVAANKNGSPSQFTSKIHFTTIAQPVAWTENRNVSLNYGGVTFYLGQTWSEGLRGELAAVSNGKEKVANVQPITEYTDWTTYNTTAYMFDVNDYSDFLEVLVAKNRIVGWQTNGNVFGTVYGTQVKYGDCVEDYMFGTQRGARYNLGACREIFTDLDYGDTVIGGFGYKRSYIQGDIPNIEAEKRVGFHTINAYRVKAGRCKLTYSKDLDGGQNIWSGDIEQYNDNGECITVPITTRYGAQPMAETIWASQKITHDGTKLTKGPLAGQIAMTRSAVLYWGFGFISVSENLGSGNAGGACLSVYDDSNQHLKTLLGENHKKIGIGFGQTGYHCELYSDN